MFILKIFLKVICFLLLAHSGLHFYHHAREMLHHRKIGFKNGTFKNGVISFLYLLSMGSLYKAITFPFVMDLGLAAIFVMNVSLYALYQSTIKELNIPIDKERILQVVAKNAITAGAIVAPCVFIEVIAMFFR